MVKPVLLKASFQFTDSINFKCINKLTNYKKLFRDIVRCPASRGQHQSENLLRHLVLRTVRRFRRIRRKDQNLGSEIRSFAKVRGSGHRADVDRRGSSLGLRQRSQPSSVETDSRNDIWPAAFRSI